jgi:membrane protein YqaA with SNARE-associated domain
MIDVLFFCILFLIVFGLNVAPAFAPPTWTVISFVSIRYGSNILLLAIVAAVAATAGRLALARLARVLIRNRLLGERVRNNIDLIRDKLESRRRVAGAALLFYAASPFPSNNLFLAYGLTTMPLKLIALPFFVGRLVSYLFWGLAAEGLVRGLGLEADGGRSFFGAYFVVGQTFTLFLVYVFTRIDWKVLFAEKRLRWMKRTGVTIAGQSRA